MNFKLRSIHLFLILLAVLILCSLGMNLKEGLTTTRGKDGNTGGGGKIAGIASKIHSNRNDDDDTGDGIISKLPNLLNKRGNIGKKGFPLRKDNGYNDSGSYTTDPVSGPSVSFGNRFGSSSTPGSDRSLHDDSKYDVNIDVTVSEDTGNDTTGAPVTESNTIQKGIADWVSNQDTSFTDPNSAFLQQFGYTSDTTDNNNQSAPQPMTETSTDINDITTTAGTTVPPPIPPPGPTPPAPPYPGLPDEADQWILKSQIVPPVCPACPPNTTCDCGNKPAPPCPPCARCPEPAFKCAKIPNYNSNNDQYLPRPVLADFSQFGM